MFEPKITVELVDLAINRENYEREIAHDDVGAHAWFLGVTRRVTGDKVTKALHYEAHREMAIQQMLKIAEEAARKFSLAAVVLVHRLGTVPVGEASVLVGCSSAHRPESFSALPWIMEVLKRDVPVWKQDLDVNGAANWIHPAESNHAAES